MKGFLNILSSWWFTLLAFFTFLVLSVLPIGEWHGNLYPTTSNTVITRVEQVSDNRIVIWGNFDKLRDCDFQSIEFRVGVPGKSNRIDLTFIEESKTRDRGLEDFGPWELHVTERQFETRVFAEVSHTCYIYKLFKKDDQGRIELNENGDPTVLFAIPYPWYVVTVFYP